MFWSPPSLANGPITGYNVYIELLAGSDEGGGGCPGAHPRPSSPSPDCWHEGVCQYQCGGGAIVIAGTGDNTSWRYV